MRIAVVGAGVVGLCCAHALLDEGHAVTVLDAGMAWAPSLGNAGWIASHNVMPLASPKMWRHVPRWLADPLGPLAIRPAYLPRLLPWLWRYLAASRRARILAAMHSITDLNRLALPEWERRLAALGLSGHLRRRGFLKLFASRAARDAQADIFEWQRRHQIRLDLVEGEALRALEPALTGVAAFYPDGVHVSDPGLLAGALREAAAGRGATLLPARIVALRPNGVGVALQSEAGAVLEAERVVVAAGAWSHRLAAGLGHRIPLETERGYNVTLPAGRLGLSRPVDFDGEGFVITTLDSGDRVGGSVEFAGLAAAPDFRRVDAMLARLRRCLPLADLSGGTRWMGFRPSLPDSLPVIGPAADPRVMLAFGHNHYGLTQAAVTGRLVADMLAGRAAPLEMAPFAAGRFA
jgi:D-amino-acid dehydrogenase